MYSKILSYLIWPSVSKISTTFWTIFFSILVLFLATSWSAKDESVTLVARNVAAIYDGENLTECNGERTNFTGVEEIGAKALASCITWQHHKWCFLQCVFEYIGLKKQNGKLNRKMMKRYSKIFPKKYRQDLLKAALWCYRGTMSPIDGECKDARRIWHCFMRERNRICDIEPQQQQANPTVAPIAPAKNRVRKRKRKH